MATEQEIAYHRTFLSPFYMDNFRPRPLPKNIVEEIRLRDPEEFEEVRYELAHALKARYTRGGMFQVGHGFYTTNEYREGSPADMQVAGVIEAAFPPQTVAKDPKTGRVALPIPTTRIRAYQEYGNRLHPVIIHPKTDQEFIATPFETDFSVLRLPNYGHDILALDRVNVFAPIVNTSWKVIGHIGRLSGASPDVVVPDWTRGLDLKQLHDTGTPAFVHDLKYPAPGGYTRLPRLSVGGSEVSFVVRTTLDGEIVDFQLGPSSGFVEPHWFSPLDIIVAVRILASLAKAGSGYVSSIMRKETANLASRAELRGASQALAQESEKRAAKQGVRKRIFYKPTSAGDSALPPGAGETDKFGNVTYSTLGSADDVALARFHETVHSFFSPKLMVLRELRADFGMWAYQQSKVVKYLEEAMAETYAQVRVKGFKGLPTGIAFPIKNGYVTVTALATEGAVATVVVGGTTYGVYYWAKK